MESDEELERDFGQSPYSTGQSLTYLFSTEGLGFLIVEGVSHGFDYFRKVIVDTLF